MSRVRHEIAPRVWLDAAPALWFEEFRLLAVADIHWGYARSQRARGRLFPEWGDDRIGARLRELIAAYRPETMVWLGDALHTLEGRTVAEAFLTAASLPILVLRGNHDRNWTGVTGESHRAGPYLFHHGDRMLPMPVGVTEVIGHLHPALALSDGAGLSLKMPVLVQGPRRWIVPAFSPWAAGVDWKGNLAPDEKAWVVSPRRIFAWRRSG